MTNRRDFLTGLMLGGAAATLGLAPARATAPMSDADWRKLGDAEWRKRLSPAAYDVLRQQGTEYPYTSPLLNEHRRGIFTCAGCALPLFASNTKFDSGTGWPSFWAPLPHAVETTTDGSWIESRTEVHCRRCAGHLGHLFDDGPKPTGLRYCMDGVALGFKPD
ncbi:MAG: peptide-methionine (R)-S-oxide reductase MsrB [Rhizomicrobium sp.]